MLLTTAEVASVSRRISLEPLHNKRIAITGGTGMVGSYLVEALCRSFEIQGVEPLEIRIISGSMNFSSISHLRNYKYLIFHDQPLERVTKLNGFQILIHAASPASPTQYPSFESLSAINSGALSKLMSQDIEKTLFISSGEVYGSEAPNPIDEEYKGIIDAKIARSSYPLAKLEAEEVGSQVCSELGADFRIARLFHSFGPGMRENDGRSFADFLWRAAEGAKPVLRSPGSDIRTFLYLEDTIIALLIVLLHDQTLGAINVGSEVPFSILEFAKRVSWLSGNQGDLEFDFEQTHYIHSANKVIVPKTSRLCELGWRQEIDLDAAIIKTLAWIKRRI